MVGSFANSLTANGKLRAHVENVQKKKCIKFGCFSSIHQIIFKVKKKKQFNVNICCNFLFGTQNNYKLYITCVFEKSADGMANTTRF